MTRLSIAAGIAAALFLGAVLPASAQPRQAGVSAAVRGQVALARASQNVVGRQVKSGDPIFLGDAITSGKDSGLQIMLLDETVFSIGPNSEISIDEFVYDPATGTGKVTASIAKGIFRFITGKIARKRPEDMTVRLPTATIGIRGTIVAGAVRAAPGKDAQVDAVFNGLKGQVPNVEQARDFVVLLGPGDENSTNDKGGAFVYTPRVGERAVRGRNAGSHLSGGGGVRVSRPNYGVTSDAAGNVSDPVRVPAATTQGMTGNIGAQPAGGAAGDSNDPNAQEANNAGDANTVSGNSLAQAGAGAFAQGALDGLRDRGGDIQDPSAGSGANLFDFPSLTAINTGIARFSGIFNIGGVFDVNGSGSFLEFEFSTRKFRFELNDITGGGIQLSNSSIQCNSNCSIDYSSLTGPAIFSADLINNTPGILKTNSCDDCNLTIGVVSASASQGAQVSLTLEHVGNTGSTSLKLPPQ